jgi:predicted transcriptional regulator
MMVNNRRSEFEIIAEILQLSETGAKSTEILYKGYLSYTQLKQYVPYLVEKGILSEQLMKNENGHSKIYFTTDKGKELLKDIIKTLTYFE